MENTVPKRWMRPIRAYLDVQYILSTNHQKLRNASERCAALD